MSMVEGARSSDRPALRRTLQQEEIVAVLRSSDRFRSAQEIHSELRRSGARVGLTTVYRHLQLLVDQGHVHALQGADRLTVYRWCSTSQGHYHIVCRHCGAATEIAGGDLAQLLEGEVAGLGFTDVSHSVEVFGICPTCRSDRGVTRWNTL